MSKEQTIKDLFKIIKNLSDSMNKRFDSVEKNLKKEIKSEIEGLAVMTQNGFNDVEKRFEALENKFEKRFDTLEDKLAFLEGSIDQMKLELDELLKEKSVNSNEILTLKINMRKLTAEVAKIKALSVN